MRVLIGCEESGKVRDAFLKLGHDAWSNDLIPARNGGPHLQKCVRNAIIDNGPWDIIILHPDCTKLSLSGNRWYGKNSGRYQERLDAIRWTKELWIMAKTFCRVGCALENPTSVIWQYIGTPMYYHPHDFGHGEVKKTGILVHRLPILIPTKKVPVRNPLVWMMPPGENRKRDRSETKQGLATAMAKQWGGSNA